MVKNIITRPPIATQGYPRADFDLEGFEAIIQEKGLDVWWETTIQCPCKTKENSFLSTCQNCLGTGWVMINRVKTKMIVHSMNSDTKYKDWSEEKLGMATITAMNRDKLSFMDRIIIENSLSIQSQVVTTKSFLNKIYCYTIYDISRILDVFVFGGSDQKLRRLIPDIDFTFERNKILFTNLEEGVSVSVRYKHNVQYHILDIVHDVRDSFEIENSGKEKKIVLPVSAIARRSHYLVDPQNFVGDNIFDNSDY